MKINCQVVKNLDLRPGNGSVGMSLEHKTTMILRDRLKLFGIPLSPALRDTLRALGIVSTLKVLFRYTFLGEFFEHIFRDAVGEDPIEEQLEPKAQLQVANLQNNNTTA